MNDGRRQRRAHRKGRERKVRRFAIKSLWLDFNNTVVMRKSGVLKNAAETALGYQLRWTAQEIDDLVEATRLQVEEQPEFRDQPRSDFWRRVNEVAFGCTSETARKMSALVRDPSNYEATQERVDFVRWLLERFPSDSHAGHHFIAASNADFCAITRILGQCGFAGQITPIVGELMDLCKPSQEFFERLLKITRVTSKETLFIANSYPTDAAAAFLGVNVIIIVPPSVKLKTAEIFARIKRLGKRITGKVFLVRSVEEAKRVIGQRFVAA